MAERRVARLLERDHELRQLAGAWRAASRGRGSLWFICAEAGGGKTRLMRELVAGLGETARWGAGESVDPPEPYLPIRKAIPGFEPAADRGESVARAIHGLQVLTGEARLLLVLDDLHFADEGTVAIVTRLAVECATRPWLVLAALRPGEWFPALRACVTEATAQGQARRLDLAALSLEAVAALVTEARGSVIAGEADRIFKESGGNPWFATALARGDGSITTARDRMLLRLDRLEAAVPGANALLASICPTTGILPHAIVAGLGGGDSPALRRVLVGLRDAGVLQESDDGGWGFRHELLRTSLLGAMLKIDQREAHRRLAEALDGHGGTAAVLAMQYALGGDPRAGAWALQAAQDDDAVDAHVDAQAQLERALSFPLAPDQRRKALELSSSQLHDLGRFADSLRTAEEASAIPGGSADELVSIHLLAARAAGSLRDETTRHRHLGDAEAAMAGHPVGYWGARLELARATAAIQSGQPAEARERYGNVLALVAGLNDDRAASTEFEARRGIGQIHWLMGDPAAPGALHELLELGKAWRLQAGNLVACVVNAYLLAVMSLFHHHTDALFADALDLMERHEFGWQHLIEPIRALELVQRSRYAEAREFMASSAPRGEQRASGAAAAVALLELRAGSLDRARSTLAATPSDRSVRGRMIHDLIRLELAVLDGDAAEQAQALYTMAEAQWVARPAGEAAVAMVRGGLPPPAQPAWLPQSTQLLVFWDWAAALAQKDARTLGEVSRRLAAIDCPYESALALADADDEGAAYRALTSLDVTEMRTRLADRLRTAGRPIPRRTRATIARDGLTATEREVCRLVSSGTRNDEIADTLGMSVRTVESHLHRIYLKTSQTSRVALAAWWNGQQAAEAATGAAP